MADYAIHDTTLTAIANTIRKKDGTSALIDPADYADRINLLGLLPVKTATKAAICNFSDGADSVPCPSVLCEINPLQASGTPSPSNPLPISGFTGLTLTKCGKNFLPTSLPTNTINATFSSNGVITSAVNARVFAIEVNKNVDFIYSCETRTTVIIGLSDKLPEVNDTITYVGTMTNFDTKTFNTGNNKYIVIGVMNSSAVETFTTNKVMIETGSTATTYVPYTAPTTLSVTWQSEAGTVYGGTLDVVSGVLTVTKVFKLFVGDSEENWKFSTANNKYRVYCEISDASPTKNNMFANYCSNSSGFVAYPDVWKMLINASSNIIIGVSSTITSVSDWRTYLSTNNLQLVYELATPQTYQLTPQEVTTLLATNNFFHDANGDTQVTYRSTNAVVDSKTITANGTYNASADNLDGYSSVSVNVAPNVGTKNITQNGTYTASSESLDGYSSVTVAVEASGGLETVLSDGVISDTTNYQTAYFSDISGYSKILVTMKYEGTPMTYSQVINVADIGNGMNITLNNVQILLTKTSIEATYYSGDWHNISASIYAWNQLPSNVERLCYFEGVQSDTVQIPPATTLDEDTNFSEYLSYDTTTKKFTVVKAFSAMVTGWVYQFQNASSYGTGQFVVNNTAMMNYQVQSTSAGSKDGDTGVFDFAVGDTFWAYQNTSNGWPQQFLKVYLLKNLGVSGVLEWDDETT